MKVRLGRKGPNNNDLRACSHHHEMNIDESSVMSPYYRGLLDQSLAINNKDDGLQNHHHQYNLNIGHNSNNNSTVFWSRKSPYYKGLTDFSLALRRRGGQENLESHDYGWRNLEVEAAYESSPYYRGLLTDYYSLAIPKLDEHGGVGPVNLSSLAFHMNLGLCLGRKDEILKNVVPDAAAAEEADLRDSGRQRALSSFLSPPAPIPLPSPSLPLPPPPLPMFPSEGKTALSMNLKVEDGKSLGERESEESAEEKAHVDLEINNNKEEDMTNEHDLDNEEEINKKSLRESVSNNIPEQRIVSAIISSESSSNKDVPQEIKEEEEAISLKEFVWANKYQPKALYEFICHKHIVAQLLTKVKEEASACDNHFIFEGPPGVGKRTMIRALLRELFGHEGVKVTEEYKTFTPKEEMIGSIQVPIKKSAHHVEVNLSQTKGYEKQVIVDLLKETYQTIILNNSLPCTPKNCQAIIIYEAERLSTELLMYIKWMLERYIKGCNKVFFCCSDESKLQIVKPLCNTFRLSPPSTQEIVEVLKYIGKEEGKELSPEFLVKVVEKSKNNLRQAIRSLEATCRNKDSIKEDELILTGWEDDIANVAKNILQEQSSKQLYTIHVKLQSLMIHKVSPDFVYKNLVSELNSLVDESLKPGLEKLEKEYNHNVYEMKLRSGKHSGQAHNKERELSDERNNELPKKNNARSYLEVEEFIAKFMSWYKSSSAKGDDT